ncbi:MAG: NAD(P)/FAD-dependent oxidoreductase, partial [Geminicoccaceae bacterium]
MAERYPIDGSRDALWMATAVEAPTCERLEGDLDVDVAIVGAGFTGLNAALALAEAGTSVAVLEAAHLGHGASGRSGGQVNLGLNLGPSALIELFGKDPGERLIDTIVKMPEEVCGLIRRHQLDCDPVQNGWVQGAATPAQRQMQEILARDYERYGAPFDVLDAEEVHQRSGAHGYQGGLFCPSAGSLHPLSYTRELARVAMEKGVRLFTESRVDALQKDGKRWQLAAGGGCVTAETVLICTNAYTDGLI